MNERVGCGYAKSPLFGGIADLCDGANVRGLVSPVDGKGEVGGDCGHKSVVTGFGEDVGEGGRESSKVEVRSEVDA